MRYSPINDGYIITKDEYEEIIEKLDKLNLRLLTLDSVGYNMLIEIEEILRINENLKG